MLAAGLGVDYALFFEAVEDDPAEQRRTLHAVIVCSLSTLLVFVGARHLSTLPVLRAIGVTVRSVSSATSCSPCCSRARSATSRMPTHARA